MRNLIRVVASTTAVIAALAFAISPGAARAAGASPDASYKLVVGGPSDHTDWNCYRINTQTGEVSWCHRNGDSPFFWTKATESEAVAPSDFDLQVRECGTAAANNLSTWVFRIDRKTGRTWMLIGSTMTAVTEPK